MKVVLFCGGLGMRIREASESVPKPMVHVGDRPILWHVMKYYAHFGHKDFILCLGYRADVIKNYFVNYNEFMSNDFVLSKGGKDVRVFNSDIDDWTVTFVDTGANSNIGQRLKAVERYLDGEEVFLANYSDNLTDFQLPKLIDRFHEQNKTAAFLVCPAQPELSLRFHGRARAGRRNQDHGPVRTSMINGGYFVFKRSIFDYMKDGEELVQEPFRRLIERKKSGGIRVRRFLEEHGHLQGKAGTGRFVQQGKRPLAVVEAARQGPAFASASRPRPSRRWKRGENER